MVQFQQVLRVDGTVNSNMILRVDDDSWIPDDPANLDYQEYLAWVGAGNTPLPAPAPETAAEIAALLRAEALSLLDSAEGAPKAQRSLMLALIDELNELRQRFNDLQADVQASNNLLQLKPKWALRLPFPARTGAELKTILTSKITSGAAD